MDILRQKAMVKSVAKGMRAKERTQAKDEKIISAMYQALKHCGKALDEVTKNDLTEKEYKDVTAFIVDVRKWPLTWYPNLQ